MHPPRGFSPPRSRRAPNSTRIIKRSSKLETGRKKGRRRNGTYLNRLDRVTGNSTRPRGSESVPVVVVVVIVAAFGVGVEAIAAASRRLLVVPLLEETENHGVQAHPVVGLVLPVTRPRCFLRRRAPQELPLQEPLQARLRDRLSRREDHLSHTIDRLDLHRERLW